MIDVVTRLKNEIDRLKDTNRKLRQKVSRMEGELREQRDKKAVARAMRAYYGDVEWYK